MTNLCESYLKLNEIMQLTPNTTEYTNMRKTLSIEEQQTLKQLKQREASKKHYQQKRQHITLDSDSDSDKQEMTKTTTRPTNNQQTGVKTQIRETITINPTNETGCNTNIDISIDTIINDMITEAGINTPIDTVTHTIVIDDSNETTSNINTEIMIDAIVKGTSNETTLTQSELLSPVDETVSTRNTDIQTHTLVQDMISGTDSLSNIETAMDTVVNDMKTETGLNIETAMDTIVEDNIKDTVSNINVEHPIDTIVKHTTTDDLEPTVHNNTITNDTFTMLRGVISNELHDRIEKLTSMLYKASEESKQHPKDKTRADYVEMVFSKHCICMQEAYIQFQNYRHENPEHTNNELCDALFKCLFIHDKDNENRTEHKKPKQKRS